VNRSWRLSIRGSLRERANPTLKWIVSGAVALVVVLLTVPVLRHAFDFGPLRPVEWLMAMTAGFVAIGWFELYKTRTSR
jgi:Ca2+-transporting ATPase